jgi:polyvinyl alcohol dehydrogenase (cytochrome)
MTPRPANKSGNRTRFRKSLGPLKRRPQAFSYAGRVAPEVWSSPAIDLKRRAVYVATGSGHTEPAAAESDAVIAFNLDTGKRLWVKQVTAEDSYVRNCPGKYRPNVPTTNKSETCPEHLGPDADFGNSPIVRTLPDGRTLVIVGQKDGHAWALDADKQGAVVWEKMLGGGFDNGGGGMMWGSAADDKLAYFPLTRGGPSYGMAAVKMASGEIAWRADPPVSGAAPVTVIPGVIFSGATNGTLYAYSTADGHALWKYDTNREFTTVNGVQAKGGNMGSPGPVIAGGMLFVPSGYSDLFGGTSRGNVLLAFSPN